MFCRRGALAALSIGFLALTACSSDAADETTPANAPSAETVQEPETPSPTPPARNDRGDLIKELEETASVIDDSMDEPWLEFAVTEIREVQCTHTYALGELEKTDTLIIGAHIEGSTAPSMKDVDFGLDDIPPVLNLGYDWLAFDSSDVRMNEVTSDTTLNCLEDGSVLPFEIGPGENFSGLALLQVSDRAGEIAFRPWWLDGGWTWSYDLDGPEGLGA